MLDPAEETVNCPYDRSHVLLKSRMQTHLPKCRARYADNAQANMRACPFNSTHIVNHMEFQYHKENCPDRIVVDSFVYQVGDNLLPKGIRPVASFAIPQEDDEDWENSAGESVLDRVREDVQNKGVLICKVGAPKAERKAHRFNERLRFAAVSSGNAMSQDRGAVGPSHVNSPPGSFKNQDEGAAGPSQSVNSRPVAEKEDDYIEEEVAASPRPPKHFSQPGATGGAMFPTVGRNKEGDLSDKMSGMGISNSGDAPAEQRPQAGSAWGQPVLRNRDEQITWPTASASAPTGSSGRDNPQPRSHNNPWATNAGVRETNHPPAGISRPAPAGISRPAPPGNPAINGIWARGIDLNNRMTAQMTSEDFPSLLPVSSRGRRPRP